jgi:hypothetical protein
LRNAAPSTGQSPSGAPDLRSNIRTASISATNKVSWRRAMPLGAFSVVCSAAPSIHLRVVIVPLGLNRLMNPLSSRSVGLPLMLETRYTSATES